MEKRETKRKATLNWQDLYANARVGDQAIKLPILDISIGGMGVLITEGFSILQEGTEIIIDNLEKQEEVIPASINGTIAYLGPGFPSRAGIEFSPADTPIEAYTELHKDDTTHVKTITDQNEIHKIFDEIKKWSRGYGDMLIMNKKRAIPAEFFYLRPAEDNMVLRIVRMSEFRLPFQPEVGKTYPFYLFKGVNVMFFRAKVQDVVKNIIETTWPTKLQYISRRSVLRYFVTGQDPITASIVHPISSQSVNMLVWDVSIEGMGVEILTDDTPLIEGMHLPQIMINLPSGPVETAGIIRSIRRDDILEKTEVGIEFSDSLPQFRDKVLEYILSMDLPSEGLLEKIP